MNNFINRKEELNSLDAEYKKNGSGLVVLYGRRRLGKTSLLKKFAENLPHCYFLADKAGEVSQLEAFSRALSEKLDAPLLARGNYTNWYDLFQAFDYVRSNKEKFVLIIDEFQYLCQVQPAFASFIQKWWDEHWQHNNLLLILCGSVTSMMYKETLTYSAPLYGRSTLNILIRPLRYNNVTKFISKTKDSTELLKYYSLAGGVPKYLEMVSKYGGFRTAFKDLVLNRNSLLFSEAKLLLQDEITMPNTCWSILQSIGEGASKISEIASRLKLPANQLTRYMDLLKSLFLVFREVPVLETNPQKSKKGVYKISDCYMKLWFGIIYPYESFIEFEEYTKGKLLEKIMPRLEKHFSECFENIARDYIRFRMLEFDCVRVGRQWGKNYEIDVVGVNEKDEISVIGECKWSNKKIGLSIYNDLKNKITENCLPIVKDCKFVLFSKSGFSEDLLTLSRQNKNILLVDDLFECK